MNLFTIVSAYAMAIHLHDPTSGTAVVVVSLVLLLVGIVHAETTTGPGI